MAELKISQVQANKLLLKHKSVRKAINSKLK